MNEKQYETEPVHKIFWKVVIPSIFAMIFSSIGMIIDGIFVGNYIGSNALAAVNLVMPVFIIIFALSDMLAAGSSVKVSMALGRKDYKEADSIFSASLLIVAALGIIFLVLGNLFGKDIIYFFIKNEELAKLSYEYTMPFVMLLPFILLFYMTDNFLRICGKVKFSMWVNILTSVMNIVLDWYLIGCLHLKIEAASYATAVSMTTGALISLIPFVMKKVTLKFSKPEISLRVLWEIVYNGSSQFFENIASSLIAIVVNGFLISLGGAAAVSAYSIVMYIDSIFRSILFGMTDSLQPFISYNAGAGNKKKIVKMLKINCIAAFTISIICMAGMMIFNESLAQIFTNTGEIEVLEIARKAIDLFAPSYIFSWFVVIVSSFLTSFDKPRESLILMFFKSVFCPIIVMVITTRFLGVNGVFVTETISEMLAFCMSVIIMYKLKRELISK